MALPLTCLSHFFLLLCLIRCIVIPALDDLSHIQLCLSPQVLLPVGTLANSMYSHGSEHVDSMVQ